MSAGIGECWPEVRSPSGKTERSRMPVGWSTTGPVGLDTPPGCVDGEDKILGDMMGLEEELVILSVSV